MFTDDLNAFLEKHFPKELHKEVRSELIAIASKYADERVSTLGL